MVGNENIENMNRPLVRVFRVTLSYDGSEFCGSQLQKEDRTVLSEVNRALSKVLNHPVRAMVASRTDAGVHANGQVIAFKTSAHRTSEDIYSALNGLLPDDVRVTECREAALDFHARYSAVAKEYIYKIYRAKACPPTLRKYVLFIEEHKPYDLDLLKQLASQLEGEHDFRSFSPRLLEGENPVKKLRIASALEEEPLTEIRFIGSGFLYQMVRRMVGLMIAINQGREKSDAVREALGNPVKGCVRYNAMPQGLFLERVFYSEDEIYEAVGKKVDSCKKE
jgi:tRNA pseudouridine38-40 synthase